MSLVVACPTCQTQLSVADSMVGQQVRCPKCSTILQTAPPTPSRPSVVLPPPPREELSSTLEEPRPRRSRTRSRAKIYLFAFLFGLIGGAAAAFFGFRAYFKPKDAAVGANASSTAAPNDLVFLPSDCQVLATMTVPRFLASKGYKLLADAGAGIEDSEVEAVRQLTGLLPEEIDRVTFGANGDDDWTIIVRAGKPVRIAELKTVDGKELGQRSVGNQAIYERTGAAAFCLVNDQIIVLGPADTLERVLKRGSPATLSDGLKTAYQPIDETWGVWAGVDLPALANKLRSLPGMKATELSGLFSKPLSSIVVESPADKPLDCQVVIRAKEEATAGAVRDQLNIVTADPPPALRDLLKDARFETIDERVAGKIAVPPTLLVPVLMAIKWENPEFWITALTSSSDENRTQAVGRLMANPQRALPLLIRALEKDPKTCTAALAVLSQMKEKAADATPAVARLLANPRPDLKLHAAKVLGDFGPKAKKDSLAALLQAESDSNDLVRQEVQKTLAKFGPRGADDAAQLVVMIGDAAKDSRSRITAIQEIAKLAPDAPNLVTALLEAIKDKDVGLRTAAAGALGKAGLKQRDMVYPALVTTLKDADAAVRDAAATSLAGFGVPTEKESALLLDVVKEANAAPQTMALAAKSLGSAGAAAGKDAYAALLTGLSHEDAAVRSACGMALDKLPPPDAAEAPALVRTLEDTKASPDTKRFVLKTLAKFGDKLDRTKVPTLFHTLMPIIESETDLTQPALQLISSLGPPPEAETPALLRLMQNKKAPNGSRAFAALMLQPQSANSPEITNAMLAALVDENDEVRRVAAAGLSKAGLKTAEAAQAIARGLADKDRTVRLLVTTTLVAMPPEAMTYPHLLVAYEDEDEAVVLKAIEGLARVEKPGKPELEALAGSLKSPHLRVRLFALSVLAEQKEGAGPKAFDPLINAARDDSATIRLMAINALAASGVDPERVAPTLVNSLKDVSVAVRWAAVGALVKLKQQPKVVVPILLEAAADKNSPGYAQSVETLGQIGEYGKPVLPLLLAALKKEETRGVASAALVSLGKDAAKDVTLLLEKAVKDKDAATQVAMLELLAKIGPDARSEALRTVLGLTTNTPAEVKAAAQNTAKELQKKK